MMPVNALATLLETFFTWPIHTHTYRHEGIALPLLCMCVQGNNRAMVSCSALFRITTCFVPRLQPV